MICICLIRYLIWKTKQINKRFSHSIKILDYHDEKLNVLQFYTRSSSPHHEEVSGLWRELTKVWQFKQYLSLDFRITLFNIMATWHDERHYWVKSWKLSDPAFLEFDPLAKSQDVCLCCFDYDLAVSTLM